MAILGLPGSLLYQGHLFPIGVPSPFTGEVRSTGDVCGEKRNPVSHLASPPHKPQLRLSEAPRGLVFQACTKAFHRPFSSHPRASFLKEVLAGSNICHQSSLFCLAFSTVVKVTQSRACYSYRSQLTLPSNAGRLRHMKCGAPKSARDNHNLCLGSISGRCLVYAL